MTANFDGLARVYQWMERLSFGGALERARFAHITALAECRDILLLGDGDGRFLKRLLKTAPTSRIRSVDASAEMLKIAAARIDPADKARVTFECADAMAVKLPTSAYDGVATLFFLDCFADDEAATLIGRMANSLKSGGTWLFADFAIPERGLPRVGARAVTAGLYAFFRLSTGIAARHLPDSEALIARAGCVPVASASSVFGLLRSVAFRRA
jgi:ubiquinone/menaquinone biosynthesis C-methylase UbiE